MLEVNTTSVSLRLSNLRKKKRKQIKVQHYNETLQILYFSFLLWINSSNKFSLHLCEALQIEPQKQKLITF